MPELLDSDIASDTGSSIDVGHKPVKAWLSVLQASGTIRIVEPFSPTLTSGSPRPPKIFFMATGLVCRLTRRTVPGNFATGRSPDMPSRPSSFPRC